MCLTRVSYVCRFAEYFSLAFAETLCCALCRPSGLKLKLELMLRLRLLMVAVCRFFGSGCIALPSPPPPPWMVSYQTNLPHWFVFVLCDKVGKGEKLTSTPDAHCAHAYYAHSYGPCACIYEGGYRCIIVSLVVAVIVCVSHFSTVSPSKNV